MEYMPPPCRFFFGPKGCKFGNSCRFSHALPPGFVMGMNAGINESLGLPPNALGGLGSSGIPSTQELLAYSGLPIAHEIAEGMALGLPGMAVGPDDEDSNVSDSGSDHQEQHIDPGSYDSSEDDDLDQYAEYQGQGQGHAIGQAIPRVLRYNPQARQHRRHSSRPQSGQQAIQATPRIVNEAATQKVLDYLTGSAVAPVSVSATAVTISDSGSASQGTSLVPTTSNLLSAIEPSKPTEGKTALPGQVVQPNNNSNNASAHKLTPCRNYPLCKYDSHGHKYCYPCYHKRQIKYHEEELRLTEAVCKARPMLS